MKFIFILSALLVFFVALGLIKLGLEMTAWHIGQIAPLMIIISGSSLLIGAGGCILLTLLRLKR